jgi:hypothetical protein
VPQGVAGPIERANADDDGDASPIVNWYIVSPMMPEMRRAQLVEERE